MYVSIWAMSALIAHASASKRALPDETEGLISVGWHDFQVQSFNMEVYSQVASEPPNKIIIPHNTGSTSFTVIMQFLDRSSDKVTATLWVQSNLHEPAGSYPGRGSLKGGPLIQPDTAVQPFVPYEFPQTGRNSSIEASDAVRFYVYAQKKADVFLPRGYWDSMRNDTHLANFNVTSFAQLADLGKLVGTKTLLKFSLAGSTVKAGPAPTETSLAQYQYRGSGGRVVGNVNAVLAVGLGAMLARIYLGNGL